MIKKGAKGIFNVGTEFKSMYSLAQQTKPKVSPIYNTDVRVPLNVSMDITKLNRFLDED